MNKVQLIQALKDTTDLTNLKPSFLWTSFSMKWPRNLLMVGGRRSGDCARFS